MKKIKLTFFVALIVCCAFVFVAFKNHKQLKTDKKPTEEKGFAVIELFTSEGCSSCPAADAVVAKLQQESANEPIYILAFHVDYWNRLGWKDVFSNADFSARQKQYAQWLNLASVYTPQIVVNGSTEFVGSDNTKLHSVIKSDLQSNEKSQIILGDLKTANGLININYKTENPPQHASMFLSIVQKTAQTKVKAGENGGRTLSHVQIVRSFKTIALNGKTSGNASLEIPVGIAFKDLQIIAFLQNMTNGNITSATKSDISK